MEFNAVGSGFSWYFDEEKEEFEIVIEDCQP